MHHRQCVRRVLFRACLIAEYAEGEHRDADPAVLGVDLLQQRGMARGVVGVEFDGVHVRGPRVSQCRDLAVEITAATRGQDHRPAGRQPPRHLDTHLAAPAEHQHGPSAIPRPPRNPMRTVCHCRPSARAATGPLVTCADIGGYGRGMPTTTARLTPTALEFVTERHLATLTTLRADGTPHVVAGSPGIPRPGSRA